MPVSYHIDKARGLVHAKWKSPVTMAEALAHADELRADPDFEPAMAQISDARGIVIDRATTGPAEVRNLAVRSPFGLGSRRAIVVDADSTFGYSRMFEAFSHQGGAEIKVFREMDAARAWLGLDGSAAANEAG